MGRWVSPSPLLALGSLLRAGQGVQWPGGCLPTACSDCCKGTNGLFMSREQPCPAPVHPKNKAFASKAPPSHCLQGSGPKELCLPELCHARKSTVTLREEVLGLGMHSLSLSHSSWGRQTGELKSTFGCRLSLGIVPRFLHVSAAWGDCQMERWHV